MKKKNLAVIFGAVLTLLIAGGCTQNEEKAPVDESLAVQSEAEENETTQNENDAKGDESGFTFNTTDIDGKAVSFSDFSDAKLIMVNFWEPWCGPCVGEMPDLEKIYEEYSSEGFVILGVFSTADADEDAREVIKSCGTTYPILRFSDDMEAYITDYVPTTIFVDKDGNVLTEEPIVGSNSYDDWKNIIEEYLNR